MAFQEALGSVDDLLFAFDSSRDAVDEPELVLGYWNIRGLADFLRLMLYYKNVKYTAKRYGLDNNDWQKDKFSLNLTFPNLPYLIDGTKQTRITESYAIGKYLAERFDVGYDSNSAQNIEEIQIEGVVHDVFMTFVRLCYNQDFETAKHEYIVNLLSENGKLAQLDAYLKGKAFLVRERELCFVDFKFFSFLDWVLRLDAKFMKTFKNVTRFYQRINGMPFMRKFEKDGLRKLPLVSNKAFFGKASVE